MEDNEQKNSEQNNHDEIDYAKIVNKRRKREKITGIIALVCLASILGGSAIGFGFGFGTGLVNNFLNRYSNNEDNNFSFTTNEPQKTNEPTTSIDNQDSVSIINNVTKSVVVINTVSTTKSDMFFGFPIQQDGSGSGIIFYEDDEKVYIVTNCHVVNGADTVSITIENSQAIPAQPVGKNAQSDLAVISVNKKDLASQNITNIKVASFGNSDEALVGEKIIAIGNALGEGNSVTSGIISAKDKKISVDGKELNVMQIDASINNGNSGGAVINSSGEVIGITTAKYAKFTVEGIAFCIPANNVKTIVEEIMNSPNKPYLGIMGINITQKIADEYGLPTIGVFVNSVVTNSNAEKYGVREFDVITKFNDKTVYTMEELSNLISKCKINDEIKLHVIRGGNGLDLKVKLEKFIENKF